MATNRIRSNSAIRRYRTIIENPAAPPDALFRAAKGLCRQGASERNVPYVRKVIKLFEFSRDKDLATQAARLQVKLNDAITARQAEVEAERDLENAPPIHLLKNGVVTQFANGQRWTLQSGVPVRQQ